MEYKAGERYKFRVMYVDPRTQQINMTNGMAGEPWYTVHVQGQTKSPLRLLKGGAAIFVCSEVTEKGPVFVLAPEYFAETASGKPAATGPMVRLEGLEEGQTLEFKTSIIFSPETHQPDSKQPYAIAKEIAAFMNSKGGTLYLGVRNDGTVCGIEQDFPVLDKAPIQEREKDDSTYHYKADRDSYAQKVRNLILGYLGGSAAALIPDLEWHEAGGRTYATLEVPPTGEDIVYLGGSELLVFRTGPQTAHLFGRQRDQYTKVRFHQGKVADFEAMLQRFRDSLLDGLGQQQQSDGVRLKLNDNESVPLDQKHVSAVKPRGLVFDGALQGEAKSWSDLYLRLLETLSRVDADKFDALPDEDPSKFMRRGSRVLFDRRLGRKRLANASGYFGPKGDIRAELQVGTRAAFIPPNGMVFRLLEHFGLAPDRFRIWTGPSVKA